MIDLWSQPSPEHCFGNPANGTGTLASRTNQKIASFYVVAIDNPGIAELYGRIDNSSTRSFTANMFNQTFIARDVGEDLQFHGTSGSIQSRVICPK
jgi:hypothetical protein